MLVRRLLIGMICFWCMRLFAQERLEFYQGVRQLGMGGVGIATVNDETALLTNPAGLGRLRNQFVTLVDPEVSSGLDNGRFYAKHGFDLFNVQQMLDALKEKPGNDVHLKAQLFPSVVLPNFGFGLLSKHEINGYVDQSTQTFRYHYTNDTAPVIGGNLRFLSGIVKLGVSARYVNRIHYRGLLPTTSTGLEVKTLASQGSGLAADVGLLLTAPIRYLPMLAVTVRDVGNTSYTMTQGFFGGYSGTPPTSLQTIDIGTSFAPILSNQTRMTVGLEYRDLGNAVADADSLKKAHAGFELNFSDAVFVRAGMNQRYWTAGVELASEQFQFQFATYGEEVGEWPVKREDRRIVTKFTYRF